MKWGVVSSRALRKRSLEIDGRIHRGAGVFPFFDRGGTVGFCMVVLPGESRLYFFGPHETQSRVPLVGAIRLRHPNWSWSDGALGPPLDGLWHFDPDWLLRHRRFEGMEIVPLLRAANCCLKLPVDVNSLHFDRDLSHARSVSRGTNDAQRTVPLTDVLPPIVAEPDLKREPGWRLAPVWTRSGPG